MYNFFNFNIIFFHLSGLPYLEKLEYRNKARKIFWLFSKILGDVVILLNTISVIMVAIYSVNDLGKFFASGMAVAYNTGFYVRYFLYRSKMAQIRDIYKNLNKFFNEYSSKNDDFVEVYQGPYKLIRNISLIRLVLEINGAIVLGTIFAIQGLYGKLSKEIVKKIHYFIFIIFLKELGGYRPTRGIHFPKIHNQIIFFFACFKWLHLAS